MPLLRHFALSLLLLAAAAVPLAAQSVSGVVRDSLGRPMQEAEVILEPDGSRTRTDASGRYSFRSARAGANELKVRLVGFFPFEAALQIPNTGNARLDVVLTRLPPRMTTITIEERRNCPPRTLTGFECRRDAGVGHFRDAGELRSLRPRYWADMLDGMPGLRREMRQGPHGLEWRPISKPSRCVRELWNGQPPMNAGTGAAFQPDEIWKPNDVVAIEYYEEHSDVPEQYRRWAWHPPLGGQPCGLIIYWLRGARRR